jgi:hypothetical protein
MLVLGSGAASAQTIYTLTFAGAVTQSTDAYANAGDGFTGTFTLQSPVAGFGAPGNYFDATASAPSDDPFQDTTTTGVHSTSTGQSGTSPDAAADVAIFSGYVGYGHPSTPFYGYQFNSGEVAPSTYQPGYEFWQMTITLESTNSLVAPTGMLGDLGNFPVSDFDYGNSFTLTLEQASYSGMTFTGYVPVATETGVITSYAIKQTTAPEPATWALLLAGLTLVILQMRGTRAVRR